MEAHDAVNIVDRDRNPWPPQIFQYDGINNIMKLFEVVASKLVVVKSEYPNGHRVVQIDPSVVEKTKYGGYQLSAIGRRLAKHGVLSGNEQLTWEHHDMQFTAQFYGIREVTGYANTWYKLHPHVTPNPDITTRRSHLHLQDILERLAHNQQDKHDVAYINQFYPEATIKKPVKMVRGITIRFSFFNKNKIRTLEQLKRVISEYSHEHDYLSWARTQKGVEYYYANNLASDRRIPQSAKELKDPVIYLQLSQRNTGIDLARLVDTADAAAKRGEIEYTDFGVSRRSAVKNAQEVLSPLHDNFAIDLIEMPAKDDNEHVNRFGLTSIPLDNIEMLYDIQKHNQTGKKRNNFASLSHRWERRADWSPATSTQA